jgi:hypothetical protein
MQDQVDAKGAIHFLELYHLLSRRSCLLYGVLVLLLFKRAARQPFSIRRERDPDALEMALLRAIGIPFLMQDQVDAKGAIHFLDS